MNTGSDSILRRLSVDEAERKAHQIRADVVQVATRNEAGHIAPSLSAIDVLTSLYYCVMRLSSDPTWEGRDRLVFSKAHGCYGLYSILADIGYLERKDWEDFYRGSFLFGCIERSPNHGIEASCGSLGHGLPLATGMAFGAKLQKKDYKVYCIVGDGELQEGSNWEAIQFAAKYRLSNLVLIVDHNSLQAMDFVKNIMGRPSSDGEFEDKLSAFGFAVDTCNGHDMGTVTSLLAQRPSEESGLDRPRALVARTVKGYGLHCMENIAKFHFRLPTEEEMRLGNRYDK
jgi:transketolase